MQSTSKFLLQRNLERLRALRFGGTAPLQRRFATLTSTSEKVIFEQHSPSVMEFKLNAPKALNSVDTEMCDAMITEMQRWNANSQSRPRALLMSGMGGKAFCAGGDIVSIYKAHMNPSADQTIKQEFF